MLSLLERKYIEVLKKCYYFEFSSIPHIRSKALFFFSLFCGGINYIDMAKIKKSDIKHGFNKDGKPIRYFVYQRSKTCLSIEIQINDDIKKQIDILISTFLTLKLYKKYVHNSKY